MNYLTPNEVALFTRRHPETVTLALRDGTLHGYQPKKNGRWLVRQDCMEAWIEGTKCPHVAQDAAAAALIEKLAA